MIDKKKMKLDDLKKYAENRALELNIQFKKTVHGKNKTELIKFIDSIENNSNLGIEIKIEPNLESKTKSELLIIIKDHPEYNKCMDKKTKKFLIDFIISKNILQKEEITQADDSISPIHFDDCIESPDIEKLKDAISKCFSEQPFDDKTYKEIQNCIF
jgi:hypothetical protein